MPEKEPIYITEIKTSITDLKSHMDKKFEEVDKRFEEVHEKLDTHFEAIGEVKVKVTAIEMSLSKKADQKDLKALENRTDKLEGHVFA